MSSSHFSGYDLRLCTHVLLEKLSWELESISRTHNHLKQPDNNPMVVLSRPDNCGGNFICEYIYWFLLVEACPRKMAQGMNLSRCGNDKWTDRHSDR